MLKFLKHLVRTIQDAYGGQVAFGRIPDVQLVSVSNRTVNSNNLSKRGLSVRIICRLIEL